MRRVVKVEVGVLTKTGETVWPETLTIRVYHDQVGEALSLLLIRASETYGQVGGFRTAVLPRKMERAPTHE